MATIFETVAEKIDFCNTGIDESLNLTNTSSSILKGVIIGVITGYIIIKMIK